MQVSQARPADNWLLRALKVLDDVFSSAEYATLLKEAEQFLWAGSEMDRVSFKYPLERFCIYIYMSLGRFWKINIVYICHTGTRCYKKFDQSKDMG